MSLCWQQGNKEIFGIQLERWLPHVTTNKGGPTEQAIISITNSTLYERGKQDLASYSIYFCHLKIKKKDWVNFLMLFDVSVGFKKK